MSLQETVLTFAVDGTLFALPVAPVVEILDLKPITPLPHTPPQVLGLIDRRGTSVPALDMRIMLGRMDGADTETTRIIVLRIPEVGDNPKFIGLRVDKVIEVATLDDDGSAPLPEADLLDWNERLVAGIGRRNGEFVTLLDVAGLFKGEGALLAASILGDAA
ncbi:MAG: chemotaxis protein CheW [Pseudomonadota bacterium]|nr:chemotaxis protein CheW [Pseudomonadota bacterium]